MFACIYIPNFSVAAAFRAEPDLQARVLAIFEGKPPLEKIIATNEQAKNIGITPGITKAQAELCPELALRPRSALQESSAHAALLDCAQSFSPCVEDAAWDTALLDLPRHWRCARPRWCSSARRATVFNEPGPPLAPGDWERYEAVVADALRGERVLACSGSLPPGAADDAYARLVGAARTTPARLAVVDVGGVAAGGGAGRGADVVTPNLAEAEGLLHGRADETVGGGRRRGRARARRGGGAGARRARGGARGRDRGRGRRGGGRRVARTLGRGPCGRGGAQPDRRRRCAGRWPGPGARARRGVRAAVALGMACGAASVETDVAGVVVPERVAAMLASV